MDCNKYLIVQLEGRRIEIVSGGNYRVYRSFLRLSCLQFLLWKTLAVSSRQLAIGSQREITYIYMYILSS